MKKHFLLKISCLTVLGMFADKATFAQETNSAQENNPAAAVEQTIPAEALPNEAQAEGTDLPEMVPLSVKDQISPSEVPSLFFTPEALALLKDAIQGLNTNTGGPVGPGDKDPGIRELALGGIVYQTDDDWTIWLNGRRITPNAIPGEIFDLSVHKEYVDIKWYDAYTNRLYPVRLRANERFNLDSRLFLTGAHTEDQQL